jgi:penicillin-binding protein 2
MSVFNQSRKNVIRLIFVSTFIIIVIRLFTLQIVSSKYKVMADDQGVFRKVVYPERGIVYDRKSRPILQNSVIYDLMVTPSKLRGTDTASICNILGIDTVEFKKRIVTAIIKNKSYRPSVFEALLSDEKMAKFTESMYKFAPAFYLQERPVRNYPYKAAANLLGYIAEVDSNFLKRHKDEGYVSGDYAGMTGLERSYEKVLMGERGIQYWKKDNKNRLTDKWEGGKYDTTAIAGQNLYTSIDVELQQLGEKLMENKLGAIVAIDPKTGGILAMVSAPTYEPQYLSGSERRKHFSQLFLNPALPLLNRTIGATYSPGSTFKTLQALVALHEGVITPDFTVSCSGAFYGCGTGRPMRCLDFGTFNLRNAITVSDNTYFATVMQRVINNPKYPNVDSSLAAWDRYMYAFGLGHRLGIDLPSEKRGTIPTPDYFNNPKIYGPGKWNYCNFRSVSIGQGEVDVTPLQVANEMAYIANKGWYITPHIVDSIEGGDQHDILGQYRKHNKPMDIPDSVFEVVHDGMQGVLERGTGGRAKVEGITICGKTGTVENYYKLVKQENHSFFCAFAPRDNPKIAIMCVVENSGRFGGTYAAPIVGLMIEKYLKDSITDKKRLAQIEELSKLNLIPKRIFAELRKQDSVRKSKDSTLLMSKIHMDAISDNVVVDDESGKMEPEKASADKKKGLPAKDTDVVKPKAILPINKKRPAAPDTVKNQ